MEPRGMDDREQTDQDALTTPAEEAEPGCGSRCPWCSAAQPDGAKHCPSCGATLIPEAEAVEREIVGLTTVDPGLIEHDQWLRSRREKKRVSILGTLLGRDEQETPRPAQVATPADAQLAATAILPPSDDVKREIARLEIEAAQARALAEAEALAIEHRIDEIDAAAARAPAPATAPETEATPEAGSANPAGESAESTLPAE